MSAEPVTVGSLCTGVAGLDLGLHTAYGGRTTMLWYSEVNPDACTVLTTRLPGVPNLGDLTAVDWAAVPRVDVLAAGFPCQPVSAAGKQKGVDDARWLWPNVAEAIRVLRPQEIVLENVRNLVSIQKGALFAQVLGDLRDLGYAVRWATAGACAVGGCHHRHRVFIVARYAWQLDAPPAERVLITECGARKNKARALLPTPTASRYGNNQGGQNPGGPVRHSLDAAHLLLPTPGAYDGARGGSQDAEKRKAGGHSVCLQDAVHGLPGDLLLPTPVVSDGARGPNPPAWPADNLTTAVDRLPDHRLLPTPVVSDGIGGPGRHHSSTGGENLRTVAAGLGDSTLLPTPTARDWRTGYDQPRPDGHPGLLNDIAQQELLPTPRARDVKGAENPAVVAGRVERGTFHGGDSLPTVAEQSLLPTPRARDGHGGDSNAAAQQARRESSALGGPSLPDVVQQQLLPGSALLPTPTVADSRNARNSTSRDPQAPRRGSPGDTLCDVVHLADPVSGTLLPTPNASDAGGGVRQVPAVRTHDGTDHGPRLRDVAPTLPEPDPSALLPTPRHSDADKGSPNQHGSRPGDLMLPSAVIGARYGRYAHAVALWEHLGGMPAPEPTVLNKAGQWRLNPRLPEWMMGYPAGWITDLVGRSAALRGAGNGVVPQVVAAVYPLLTAGWSYLQGGDVCPDPIAPALPGPAPDARPARLALPAGPARPAAPAPPAPPRPEQLALL